MNRLLISIAALALVVAACGGDDAESTTTAAPAASTEAPTTAAPAGGLAVAASDLGDILVDGEGRTLYLFTPDVDGVSVCYDDCEAAWPVFYQEDLGEPGAGIDAGLVGTAPRNDGTTQVTYGGWPLYYFAGDNAAGDSNGQGVNDVWFVVGPDGNGIGVPEPAAAGLSLAASDLGDILVDGDGNVLYLFLNDSPGETVCYDQCADNWPPFLDDALGEPGAGIDAGLLGTTERTDGSTQVTYGGWPLYSFAGDDAAGDTNGQGVGEVWYVLGADGTGIGVPEAAASLVLSSTDLGEFLVDGDGNTLYLFTVDTDGVSACYDQCEANWPPFLDGDGIEVGDGVDAALVGTTERTDGSIQVTYGGWPLYYFAGDDAAGDTNGQAVNDVWWVVDAAGDAIT